MSNVLTTFPYTNTIVSNTVSNTVPFFPGAYIFRGSAGANGMVPIYTSIPSIGDNGMNEILKDRDAQVLVLPGFALQLYTNESFVTLNTTVDNSGGTEFLSRNSSAPNTCSSCKLFYKFPTGYSEIPSILFKSVTFSISPSVTTSEVIYLGVTYRLYSFTSTAQTHTVSINDTTRVGVDCLYLLIGGGGGGGAAAVAGQVAGSGGGGAGAMVYGSIKLTQGATFNITVGAGGAGNQTSAGIGSPSSITMSGSVNATLSVGGGGSGGGPGDASTLQGSYPSSGIGGSTGGPWPGYGASQPPRNTINMWAITGTSGIFAVTAASANTGGNTWGNTGGGGGGGAGGRGAYATATNTNSGGGGGPGTTWPVTGPGRLFAAGGGGNNMKDTAPWAGGAGGSSIGGNGGTGTAGAANTGSGGGAKYDGPAGAGGSGICIIAVPLYRVV